ncbi:putative non-specific serine/threonine protein kinase [Helianthus debilis subsp. tardiflorus]
MEITIEASINSRYSSWVREHLDELPHSFTISDPWIPGHPIVFASKELLKRSGYSRQEVVGNNGRMFQGIKTNRRSVMEIRHAVREERTIQLPLLNYMKNGTPFWIFFHMFPVFSKEDGRVVHFVGVQVPITPTRSASGLCEYDAAAALRFCRREVCSDTIAELTRIRNLDLADHDTESTNAAWKVSDLEKREASNAMGNILSLLTHYSQLTGKLVSEKRCCSSYMSGVGASLNISLARIKHSFVLFLSGQETDVSTELQITNSIEDGKPCTVCILNYRKDGSPFWNSLHISPVRNASGRMNVNRDEKQQNLRPEMSVVAAVKVAVRTSGMMATTSNS